MHAGLQHKVTSNWWACWLTWKCFPRFLLGCRRPQVSSDTSYRRCTLVRAKNLQHSKVLVFSWIYHFFSSVFYSTVTSHIGTYYVFILCKICIVLSRCMFPQLCKENESTHMKVLNQCKPNSAEDEASYSAEEVTNFLSLFGRTLIVLNEMLFVVGTSARNCRWPALTRASATCIPYAVHTVCLTSRNRGPDLLGEG